MVDRATLSHIRFSALTSEEGAPRLTPFQKGLSYFSRGNCAYHSLLEEKPAASNNAHAPVKSPAVREQSAAQASPSPDELKLTLKVLKERAMSSGSCGRKPEEYGQVWGAKLLHLFGGPLHNTDFAKPSVLGKIASDIALHIAAERLRHCVKSGPGAEHQG